MPLVEMPDIGQLVQWFLLAQSEITDIYGQEVYVTPPEVTPPAQRTYPFLRVTAFPGVSIAGSATGPFRFLIRTPLQVDSIGGDEFTARRGAELAAATLELRLRDVVTFGGVTACVTDITTSTPRALPPIALSGNDVSLSLALPAKPAFFISASICATPA